MWFIDCSYSALIIAMQQPQCITYAYTSLPSPWQLASEAGALVAMTDGEKKRLQELLEDNTGFEVSTWITYNFSAPCKVVFVFLFLCLSIAVVVVETLQGITFQCSCIASAYLIQLKISIICLKHCDQVALLWHHKPNNNYYSSIYPPTVASQS